MVRRYLLIALVAFVAGLGGVFAGRAIAPVANPTETEVHALLHGQLDLTPDQQQRIDVMERRFAVRRHGFETEMRAANVRLANAIDREHGYGPQVTAAIHDTHRIMGLMQSAVLQHLFAMRDVLDERQAQQFDATVMKALTAAPQ